MGAGVSRWCSAAVLLHVSLSSNGESPAEHARRCGWAEGATSSRSAPRGRQESLYAADLPARIVPDPSETLSVWEGWGVSLCWWASVFGMREDIADAVFSLRTGIQLRNMFPGLKTPLPGLGLNIVRYNAGASGWKALRDGQQMQLPIGLTHNWKLIHSFWQDDRSWGEDSSSWNWTADDRQVNMLRLAKTRGADRFELFSNSPPWWMLTNLNPAGAGDMDNLLPRFHKAHAAYLATIVAHAATYWGINFESVSPFNEPTSDWWRPDGKQEGCYFSRSTQSTMIWAMRKELDRRKLSTIVSASDENNLFAAQETWLSFDESTQRLVGRINVHGYQYVYRTPPPSVKEWVGAREWLFHNVNGKPLWNSEYSDEYGSGVYLAMNLTYDMYFMRISAYIHWQVLDADEGWGFLRFYRNHTNDASQWWYRPVEEFRDDDGLYEFYPENKYFVMAQFTRHIRPGMVLFNSTDPRTVVAWNLWSKVLVIVSVNDHSEARHIDFDLRHFYTQVSSISSWRTSMAVPGFRYVSSETYARTSDYSLDDCGRFSVKLNAMSVQTFEIPNVELEAWEGDRALVALRQQVVGFLALVLACFGLVCFCIPTSRLSPPIWLLDHQKQVLKQGSIEITKHQGPEQHRVLELLAGEPRSHYDSLLQVSDCRIDTCERDRCRGISSGSDEEDFSDVCAGAQSGL